MKAPWPDARQIEQDMIISRALCDLFDAPMLKGKIAFRGGTAINKLLFKQPLRYSEDIDLVQTQAESIGTTVDAIREALSWLGKCNREQAGHSMHLVFKFICARLWHSFMVLSFSLGREQERPVDRRIGQTFRSPPAKPGGLLHGISAYGVT